MSIGVVSKRSVPTARSVALFAQNRNFAKTKSSTSVGRHSAARAVSGWGPRGHTSASKPSRLRNSSQTLPTWLDFG